MSPEMNARLRTLLSAVAIIALSAPAAPANAGQLGPGWNLQIGPTSGQIIGASLGIAGAGAALGFGTYYALHHGHSLVGCTASGAHGLQLLNGGDQQTYFLVGKVDGVKTGELVRVSGKKEKSNAGGEKQFLVAKLNKDLGPCAVPPGAL
jgi:hypothetical protein